MTGLGFVLLALLLVGFSVAVVRCQIAEARVRMLEAELERRPVYAAVLEIADREALIEEVPMSAILMN